MQELTKQELMQCRGGFSVAAASILVIGIIFLIGLIDGYIHPKGCA